MAYGAAGMSEFIATPVAATMSPEAEAASERLAQMALDAVKKQRIADEKIIRKMMEQWVSELEPVVVYQQRSMWTKFPAVIIDCGGEEIVGLTARGHDKVAVWRDSNG